MAVQETSGLKTHPAGSASVSQIVPSISAGMVNGILIVIFQSAYAAMIFSGDLSPFLSRGIGFLLGGAFLMGLTVAITSSYHSNVTAPQDASTAIMAVIAATMAGSMSTQEPRVVFISVLFAMMLTTLTAGVVLITLGTFRLGNLIRFIPYPVVGGFLAGTGWILIKGALGIMSGQAISLENWINLFSGSSLFKWLPGLLFALILFAALRRFRHFLTMPIAILLAIILFYTVLFLSGVSPEQARLEGWLLSKLDGGISWQPPVPADLARVNWGAIFQQSGELVTVIIISAISLLLNASGLELVARQEIDLNRELRSAGLANLLAGWLGSPVGYMSLSLTALSHRIGSRSRLSGIVSASLCGLTLLAGLGISAYFPRPLLGGLLFYLGLTFLVEWLYHSWKRLPRAEYLLVIIILLTIAVLGFLPGMFLGVLIAGALFVINYSRINVVKHTLSGENYRSNVDRAPEQQRQLDQRGGQLYILQLQGYIFFGTANNLLDQVKRRFHDPQQPLQLLVLDFRLVNGLDSSALNSFAKLMLLEETLGFRVIFSHLSPKTEELFRVGGVLDEASDRLFPDLDRAVEWCENQILALSSEQISAPPEAPLSKFFSSLFREPAAPPLLSLPEFLNRLNSYLTHRAYPRGEYIIRQGAPPSGLYFIEAGQVTAQLEQEDSPPLRLRTMNAGTVVGELGVYLGTPASAAVVAEGDCQIYFLSLEQLNRMEQEAPKMAGMIHKFMIRILGERLINSNKTIRALLS